MTFSTPPNINATKDSVDTPCQPFTTSVQALESLMAQTCFCKLRAHCDDKNSADCLKHRNLYAEFMQRNQDT